MRHCQRSTSAPSPGTALRRYRRRRRTAPWKLQRSTACQPTSRRGSLSAAAPPAGATPSQLILDVVFASQPKTDKFDGLEDPEARQTGEYPMVSLSCGDPDARRKLVPFPSCPQRPATSTRISTADLAAMDRYPVRFESGRRAILTFATGKTGADAIYAAVHSTD